MGMELLLASLLLLSATGNNGAWRGVGLVSTPFSTARQARDHQLPDAAFPAKVLESRVSSSQRDDVPPDFFCHSCQEVSKKVERFLADPSLYDEVNTMSDEVCQIFHPELQVKCRRIVELYLREGILFLQILFLEKNICNNTGFCPLNVDNGTSSSIPSSDDSNTHEAMRPSTTSEGSESELSMEMDEQPSLNVVLPQKKRSDLESKERKRCETCHVAAEQIRKGLEDHEHQINVIKTLLNACELVQTYADKCKRMVFQYGPLGLANLQKFLGSTDFCHLIRLCEESTPPKGITADD